MTRSRPTSLAVGWDSSVWGLPAKNTKLESGHEETLGRARLGSPYTKKGLYSLRLYRSENKERLRSCSIQNETDYT